MTRFFTTQFARLLALFLALAAAIGTLGWWTYTREVAIREEKESEQLQAIADFKVAQIEDWLSERRRDVRTLVATAYFAADFRHWLTSHDARSGERLQARLETALHLNDDYIGIELLDRQGISRFAVGPILPPSADTVPVRLAAISHSSEPLLTDLHRDGRTGQISFSYLLPIRSSDGSEPFGYLRLVIDPARHLYPLLQAWPIPSASAEALLVRRDEGNLLFLNELRHRRNTALAFRLPADREDLVEAAAPQHLGSVKGLDYRGVPVLAYIWPVTGTPWFMLTKVDRDEVLHGVGRIARASFFGSLLAIAGSGLVLWLVWRKQVLRDRLAALDALRESQQRFAGIVESAMDAIISIDQGQRIVLFNAAAEVMFRCPAPEAMGSSLERFIPVHCRSAHAEHIRHFERMGTTSRSMGNLGALSGLRRDGSEFPIEASISQIAVGGEKLFTVILRDVTERVRAEAEIRRLNADLEQRVRERTAELAQSNEALLKSNLELQHFAHVAAHDLQTPLRSIAGFAQILRRDCEGRLGEFADECIGHIVDNAKRMHLLIQGLLGYSRLDSQPRPFEATDFRQLFDEVVATLAVPIREAGAEVACAELPTLMVDRTQFAQVLQNLIENGIKYNTSAQPRVCLSAEKQGGEWVFSVSDNGIGVDPRYHERIFEIFRRLHTYHAYPGTGIGLAICQRVVARHGGRIWVDSREGEGSTFHFTLPAVRTEVARSSKGNEMRV